MIREVNDNDNDQVDILAEQSLVTAKPSDPCDTWKRLIQ